MSIINKDYEYFNSISSITGIIMQNGGTIAQIRRGFASGNVAGYSYRIFKEKFQGKKTFYVVINDESSDGVLWPALYTKKELDQWFKMTLSKYAH